MRSININIQGCKSVSKQTVKWQYNGKIHILYLLEAATAKSGGNEANTEVPKIAVSQMITKVNEMPNFTAKITMFTAW